MSRSSVRGNAYHVMRSERDDPTAWSYLAESGVELLPAIVAGLRGGQGQSEHLIQVKTHLFGVAPRPAPRGL